MPMINPAVALLRSHYEQGPPALYTFFIPTGKVFVHSGYADREKNPCHLLVPLLPSIVHTSIAPIIPSVCVCHLLEEDDRFSALFLKSLSYALPRWKSMWICRHKREKIGLKFFVLLCAML